MRVVHMTLKIGQANPVIIPKAYYDSDGQAYLIHPNSQTSIVFIVTY